MLCAGLAACAHSSIVSKAFLAPSQVNALLRHPQFADGKRTIVNLPIEGVLVRGEEGEYHLWNDTLKDGSLIFLNVAVPEVGLDEERKMRLIADVRVFDCATHVLFCGHGIMRYEIVD